MSTLNLSLSRSKYVVWLWLFGISLFRIKGVLVLLRFATVTKSSYPQRPVQIPTHVLPSVPNTCRSTTARPRRYSKTSYSTCPVSSGLLQRRAGQSSSFHAGTASASPARSSAQRSGSQAAWPCDSSSSRVALVASRWEDPVQAVLAGSQILSGTHAGIHLGPSDIGSQYCGSIYALIASSCVNLVVPRTRRWIGDRAFSVRGPIKKV